MSDFRAPYDAVALRAMLAGTIPDPALDAYIAAMAERDRVLEDYLNSVDRQIYAAQLLTGDVVSVANAETTVVTLGTQQYQGGRTYEIRATASVMGSAAGTRGICRLLNASDTLRVNLFDGTFPGQLNTFTTYGAIMVFQPPQDCEKEFRITFQNGSAVGNFTVCGSPLAATGGVAALLTANQVGGAT